MEMITPEEDAEIERIMGLSEEDLYAEIRAEGGDPEDYVRRFDEILKRVKTSLAVTPALPQEPETPASPAEST